jgi:uncharacterized caspase-like protein
VGRHARLIGNRAHSDKNVGPLRNPHNDIALIGTVLEELGFRTILVKDPD